MTTVEWLDQAEARCAAATAGSWVYMPIPPPSRTDSGWRALVLRPASNIMVGIHRDAYLRSTSGHCVGRTAEHDRADLQFIASARTDLPRALKIVRAAMEWQDMVRSGSIGGFVDDAIAPDCRLAALLDEEVEP